MDYSDIVEVVQTSRWPKANSYLAAGYRLLAIEPEAWPQGRTLERNFYVRKTVEYVLGRTAAVEHIEVDHGPAWRDASPTVAEPAEASS